MSSRVALFLETAVLFFLSIALFKYRIPLMFISLTYIWFFISRQHFTLKKLGFKWPKLSEFLPIIPVLIISWMLPQLFNLKVGSIILHNQPLPLAIFIPIYLFISVPLQEFIFRGFYISRLELVSKNRTFLIIYSSVIFALIHLPFHSLPILIGTFFLGIYLAYLFLQQRNIWILMLIHAFMIYFVLLSK
jgi:membrane protease YdiL (CAAX protease family)